MTAVRSIMLVGCVLLLAGCYHATIDTGLPPSSVVYHQPFASCWVYGLVPPKTVKAALECEHGVAKVETKLSFLNGLVGALTFSIYTPMDIKVTCASAGGTAQVPDNPDIVIESTASEEEIRQAFMTAADLAVAGGQPVYVAY